MKVIIVNLKIKEDVTYLGCSGVSTTLAFSEVGEEEETQEERREMKRREGGREWGEDWSILSTGVAELNRCISPETYQSTETFLP